MKKVVSESQFLDEATIEEFKQMKEQGRSIEEIYFEARSRGKLLIYCLRIVRECSGLSLSLAETRDEIERLEPLWVAKSNEVSP